MPTIIKWFIQALIAAVIEAGVGIIKKINQIKQANKKVEQNENAASMYEKNPDPGHYDNLP